MRSHAGACALIAVEGVSQMPFFAATELLWMACSDSHNPGPQRQATVPWVHATWIGSL